MSESSAPTECLCDALKSCLFETFTFEVEFSQSIQDQLLQNDELLAAVLKIFKRHNVTSMLQNGLFKKIKISKEHLQHLVIDLEQVIKPPISKSCDELATNASSVINHLVESPSSATQRDLCDERLLLQNERQMLLEEVDVRAKILKEDQNGFENRTNVMENKFDPQLLEKSSSLTGEGCYSFYTASQLHVHICRGDIVHQKVEAIVNAANVNLQHGSGVARRIADVAGQALVDECQAYINQNGALKTSIPMHTGAGALKLPILYVIHVAGPRRNDHGQDLLQDLLMRTFENVLDHANGVLKVSSVAIPAISSGIYGVDQLLVASCCYQALQTFERKIQTGTIREINLVDICFVNIDEETTHTFGTVFQSALQGHNNPSSSRVSVDQNSPVSSPPENQRRTATPRTQNSTVESEPSDSGTDVMMPSTLECRLRFESGEESPEYVYVERSEQNL